MPEPDPPYPPPYPTADWYEALLADLYRQQTELLAAHQPHPLGPGPARKCPHCGTPAEAQPAAERVCRVNERCDAISQPLWDVLDQAFPPEHAPRWVADPPAPDWLWWGNDGAGIPGDGTIADFMADAMQHDAHQRLWPDADAMWPTIPSTTRPTGGTDGG